MAERCHCGREWVTAVKEEVVKPLEKQFQSCIYSCVRTKRDGMGSMHLKINRVNLYVKGTGRRLQMSSH